MQKYRRHPRPRALCVCPDCGEVFTKPKTLEHHQAIRHAGNFSNLPFVWNFEMLPFYLNHSCRVVMF
jgi:Zinc finger, C2H2 type